MPSPPHRFLSLRASRVAGESPRQGRKDRGVAVRARSKREPRWRRSAHAIRWLVLLSFVDCDGSTPDPDPPADCSDGSGLGCVRLVAVDPSGAPIPCRLSFEGLDGTSAPSWSTGPGHVGEWLGARSIGVGPFIVAAPCDVDVILPEGRYRVTASRGPAWSVDERVLVIEEAGSTDLTLEIEPVVDVNDFACADFHVHSAPSFDSDVPLDQRLISALAEGLDAIAATDHGARGDWAEPLAALGLEGELLVLVGNEITPDHGPGPRALGHFNVYPVPPSVPMEAFDLGFGAADLVLENARRLAPDAVLQVNHPRWNGWIGYFTVIDFDPTAATSRLEVLSEHFDAIEVYNGHELDRGGPTDVELVLRDWYSLLNGGRQVVATGNSDTHRLAQSPLGFPRTCVRVERDGGQPVAADELLGGLRSGAALVTSGPWIEARIGGVGLGGMADLSREVTLEVRIDAPPWVPVDRYAVVLNGRVVERREIGALPFVDAIPIEVTRDSWLVVRAEGDRPLGIAAGAPAHPMRSLAFTNPIYLDAEGDGSWGPPGH